MRYNIRDFGAVGDGRTNDGPKIQEAIDECAQVGGGIVIIPGGKTYLSGQLELKSHVNLHLEAGSRLIASLETASFPEAAFLSANDVENVSITGTGTIDGQGTRFMREELSHIFRTDTDNPLRPHMILFTRCHNLTFRDFTLRDSPHWTLHLAGCEDVVIDGIRILNNLKVPNCDGIDPNRCRNVRISNCHIEAGDDCIVLKTLARHAGMGPCENITVTGCTLVSTSAALKIGTESQEDIRNVVFDSCVIRGSNRGLAIQLRDEGNVENVLFSNCIVETRLFHDDWWGKAEPIYVTALHRKPGSKLGQVRNVRFSNILCKGENGAYLAGSPDSPLEDVVLDNVRLEINKTSQLPGGHYDRRPCENDGLVSQPTAGIYIEQARSVTLRDVKVVWGPTRDEAYRHALEAHAVENLNLDNFDGNAAFPERDQPTLVE